jgi:hypothetical protein
VEVLANRLRPDERRGWQCDFRDRTEFGHDKAAVLRAARGGPPHRLHRRRVLRRGAPPPSPTRSSRRARLVAYCRRQGIACTPIASFDDVRRALEARLPDVLSGTRRGGCEPLPLKIDTLVQQN